MSAEPEILLIVDVEATCWQGAAPPGQQSEIIEIGLCTLARATGERLERESILVRPQRSKVSPFCTELTTLTQEEVDQGIPFAEACELLRTRYRSPERAWASYGAYDQNQFLRQCDSFYVPYPFGEKHINVKALFAEKHGLRRPVGMAGALRILDVPLEGTHHRGGDDAWNIAGILARLLERRLTGDLPTIGLEMQIPGTRGGVGRRNVTATAKQRLAVTLLPPTLRTGTPSRFSLCALCVSAVRPVRSPRTGKMSCRQNR